MLLAQDVLFLLVGETGFGGFVRIGGSPLADAASANKDLSLQEQFVFTRFALHVVNRAFVLDVGIEAKNHGVLINLILHNHRHKSARMLKAGHKTARSLDTPSREIYSRMFS